VAAVTAYYRVKRSRPRHTDAPALPHLYIVTSKLGARVVERKSMNSEQIVIMPQGFVFHGTPSERWIRVLGGGYCVGASVREVV
jgi:hypothetical protein